MATKIHVHSRSLYMVFVCIQFDGELWFHFRCVSSVCALALLNAVVLARLCIVFFIMRPMMHKNSQPFFVPLAIWQAANLTGKRDRTRAIFRLYIIFLRHSMKCYDKTSWILKRTHVFLINARMRSVRLMNSQAHAHATTPIAGRNMCQWTQFDVRFIIMYYCLCLSTNIHCLMHQNIYPSIEITVPFYVTQRNVVVTSERKQRRQQPAHQSSQSSER